MKKGFANVMLIGVVVVLIGGYFVFAKKNTKWPFQRNTATITISHLGKQLQEQGYKPDARNFFDRSHLWWIHDDGLIISAPNSASFEFEIPTVQAYETKKAVKEPVIQKIVLLVDDYMQSNGLALQVEQSPSVADVDRINHGITRAYFDSSSKLRCRFETANLAEGDDVSPYTLVGQVKCVNDSQFVQTYKEQASFLKYLPEETYKTYTVGGKEIQTFAGIESCANDSLLTTIKMNGMGYTGYFTLQKNSKGQWMNISMSGYNLSQYCQFENNISNETKDWTTYQDDENGFEIKYPSTWTRSIHGSNLVFTNIDPSKEDSISISYVDASSITDSDSKFGFITYFYDKSKGSWMKSGRFGDETGIKIPITKAVPEFYTTDELAIFIGTSRWKTYIVPLSQNMMLKLNITGSGDTKPLDMLVRNIKKLVKN